MTTSFIDTPFQMKASYQTQDRTRELDAVITFTEIADEIEDAFEDDLENEIYGEDEDYEDDGDDAFEDEDDFEDDEYEDEEGDGDEIPYDLLDYRLVLTPPSSSLNDAAGEKPSRASMDLSSHPLLDIEGQCRFLESDPAGVESAVFSDRQGEWEIVGIFYRILGDYKLDLTVRNHGEADDEFGTVVATGESP